VRFAPQRLKAALFPAICAMAEAIAYRSCDFSEGIALLQ